LNYKDYFGDIITLIEESISFVLRHSSKSQYIPVQVARRQDIYDYPPIAIREAIVNAFMHRDYYNDSSHVFIHLFSDRLEIENPGGLLNGLSVEEIGERSVRRNRSIADLLFRAGYAEKIGSGIQRIKKALSENQNPPFHITSSNYFVIILFPRIKTAPNVQLTERQAILLREIEKAGKISIARAAEAISSSSDTALREMRALIGAGIVERTGSGRAIRYDIKR
jgi:ATP-dependent DNA helicase RecG